MKHALGLISLCIWTLIWAAFSGAALMQSEWGAAAACLVLAVLFLALALERVERNAFAAHDDAVFRAFTGGRRG
jgi:hypothetical protein